MEKKSAARQIIFEGRLVPSPALLEDERMLGTIEAKFWDIGLIGFLLRHKERLVITTHRIFQFSRQLTSGSLHCLELAKVESIYIGGRFKWLQFLIGLVCVIAPMLAFESYFLFLSLFGALNGLAIGLPLMFFARQKELRVRGSDAKNMISLPLRRIKVEESKCFIDLVCGAIRNIQKTATSLKTASNQVPVEAVSDSLNADDSEEAHDEIRTSDEWVYPPPSSHKQVQQGGRRRDNFRRSREFLE
jgi:hypothetical protein